MRPYNSESSPPGFLVTRIDTRIVTRHVTRVAPLPDPLALLKRRLRTVTIILVSPRRSPEHGHWRPDFNRIVECGRHLLGHANAAMRCRIARQITGVQPVRAVESHEIGHRRRHKLSAG